MASFISTTDPPVSGPAQSQHHSSHVSDRIQPDDYDSGYESDYESVRPSFRNPFHFHEAIDRHALSRRQTSSPNNPPLTYGEPSSASEKCPKHDSPTPKSSRGNNESHAHNAPSPSPPPSSPVFCSPSPPSKHSPSPSQTLSRCKTKSPSAGVRADKCDASTQTPDWWGHAAASTAGIGTETHGDGLTVTKPNENPINTQSASGKEEGSSDRSTDVESVSKPSGGMV